jgi:hypothetical protein
MASEINIENLLAAREATENLTKSMKDQRTVASALSSAYTQGAASLGRMQKKGKSFGGTFASEMSKSGKVTQALSKALNQSSKSMGKAGKAAAVMAGAMRGAAKAMDMLGKGFATIKASLPGLLKSFISLNVELMLAPLKITDALMKMANEAAKAGVPVAQAAQNLHEGFGSAAIGLKKMTGQVSKLEGELGNMTAYMSGDQYKILQKAATDLGESFWGLSDSAKGTGRGLVTLSKVLGFGAEEMSAVGNAAISLGLNIDDMTDTFTQYGYAMQEATGVTQSVIAKDMAGIMGDVKNFGNMAADMAATTAARMRSLGSSFKSLGKITDKFMNFDNAAKSAASLGQAFGMALNPLQMMKNAAKDPLKNLDMLRKSMFNAGKSSETMNAAQLRLLASQTGLSESEARLMFSSKNRGKSTKDLKKANKDQLSDAERMEKAVANLTTQFSHLVEVLTEGGIMANIQKGMTMYMQEHPQHLKKFQAANQHMLEVGYKLGAAIGKALDSGVFDEILDVMSKLPRLMDVMSRNKFFEKLFSGDFRGAFDALSKSFKTVFRKDLPEALDAAGSYFINFAANIVEKFAAALGGGISGKGMPAMTKAFDRLGKAWMSFFKALWPHIAKFLGFLLDEIWKWMKANPWKAAAIGMILMGNMFGPSVIAYAVSALVGGLWGGIKTAGSKFIAMGKSIGKGIGKGLKSAGKGIKSAFSRGKMYKGGQVMSGSIRKGTAIRAAKGGTIGGRGRLAGVTDAVAKGADKMKTGIGNLGSKFPKITSGLGKMGKAASYVGTKLGSAGKAVAGFGSKAAGMASKGASFAGVWGGKAMAGITKFGGAVAKVVPGLGRLGAVAGGAGKVASRIMGTGGMLIGTGINSLYEGFKGFGKAVEAGGNMADKIGGAVIGGFKGIAEGIDFMSFGMLDKMTGFNGAFENLDFGYIGETFSYMGSEMWSGIKNIGANIAKPFKALGGAMKGAWNKATAWAKDAGKHMVDGITSGAKKAASKVKSAAKSVASGAKKLGRAVGGLLGFGSPSKWFRDNVGHHIGTGIHAGVELATSDGAKTMAKKVGGFMTRALGGPALGAIVGFGKRKFGPAILKGLDFTKNIKNSAIGKAAGKVFDTVSGGITRLFGIRSPSRVMERHGENMVEGMQQGIETAMAALELITPEIAASLGFDESGELTAEAKSAMIALENTQTILGSVIQIVDDLNAVGETFTNFDAVAMKANMTAALAAMRSVMLGPDGFLQGQADLASDIRAQQEAMVNAAGNAGGHIAAGAFDAARANWNEAGGGRETIGGDYDPTKLGAALQSEANAKQMNAEIDGMNAQNDMIGNQLGAFTGLLEGMTELVETGNEMKRLTANFDSATLIRTVTDFSTRITTMFSVLDTTFATWSSNPLYNVNQAISDAQFDLMDLNDLVQDRFLESFIPEVWSDRIATAHLLQDNIEMLATEMATINTMMTGIPSIELRATIDDIEDQLSIVEEFTKVSGKPLNLTFKLDIHMSANKMAKAILQTEVATHRLRFKNAYPPR